MATDCIFCQLLDGDGPAEWLHRGDHASALLPRPAGWLAPGHTLVISNEHAVGVQDVSPEGLRAVALLVQRVAREMRTAIGASGVNVLNASGPHSDQSVDHLHVHVVPRWTGDGLDTWPGGRSTHVPDDDWLPALRSRLATDVTASDVVLRRCVADDLPGLEAWAPTGNSRTHALRFARQQAGTSTYYLAVCRQAPDSFVGSCEIRWDGCAAPEVPRCPEVNGLQVWPEHLQSRGIGTQMLRLLEVEVRGRGQHTIGLGVDDPRARALYRRLGYQDSGLDYVDRYTWVDDERREHQVADRARWLMKPLPGGRP